MKILHRVTGELIKEVEEADLRGADLCWANLSEANLYEANLNGATLTGTDLTGADLNGVDFRRADITGAKGILVGQFDKYTGFATSAGIQLGCEYHSLEHWVENFEEIRINNKYSSTEIKYYGQWINNCADYFGTD